MFHVKYLSSSLYGLGGQYFFKFFLLVAMATKVLHGIEFFEQHLKYLTPNGLGEVILMKKFTDGRCDYYLPPFGGIKIKTYLVANFTQQAHG